MEKMQPNRRESGRGSNDDRVNLPVLPGESSKMHPLLAAAKLTFDCLTDLELAAVNNAAQVGWPLRQVVGYKTIQAFCNPDGRMRVEFLDLLASEVLRRLSVPLGTSCIDGSEIEKLQAEIDRLRDVNADLLAACQAALAEFNHGMSDIDRLRSQLEAAIAKATGTTES